MSHLARELKDILAGPPKIHQIDLVKKTGLPASKISRILSSRITADARTADALVAAVPAHTRQRLAIAILRDYASPLLLSILKGDEAKPFSDLTLPALTKKGRWALEILGSKEPEHLSTILFDLATAMGYEYH